MRCKNCGDDIQESEPKVVVKVERKPCECGMTGETRAWRYAAMAFTSLMLCIFGSCLCNQWLTLRQTEIIKDNLEIRERGGSDPLFRNSTLPFEVREKKEQK